MSSQLIMDLARIDQSRVEYGIEEIRKINPHRFEFEQLTGIFQLLREEETIVGFRDLRPDEFWVRGHIPGLPLFPGVLQVEACAQLCSFYQKTVHPTDGFFGFGGIDEVKFRQTVRPGDRLILMAKAIQLRPRRSIYQAQGVVNGKLAIEAQITGMTIPPERPPA
jgi:3-hydroxyacyl-[acyl-carrier-protein] dehydratase